MEEKHKTMLIGFGFGVLVGALALSVFQKDRYEFQPATIPGCIWRLDKSSGRTELINANGNPVVQQQ